MKMSLLFLFWFITTVQSEQFLSWDSVDNAESYNVYMAQPQPEGVGKFILISQTNNTEFEIQRFDSGVFTVRSISKLGVESEFSSYLVKIESSKRKKFLYIYANVKQGNSGKNRIKTTTIALNKPSEFYRVTAQSDGIIIEKSSYGTKWTQSQFLKDQLVEPFDIFVSVSQ